MVICTEQRGKLQLDFEADEKKTLQDVNSALYYSCPS